MPVRPHARSNGAGAQGRRDASMVLLTSLGENSLDAGYARAAARLRAGEPPAPYGPVVLAVGLLAIGLLLATAAAQVRARAPSSAQARSALAAEIEDRTAANDRLETTLSAQRAAVSRERRAGLRRSAQGSLLARSLARLEAVTGAGSVGGPGMVVRLSEPEPVDGGTELDPRSTSAAEGRVSDRDLQTVVNEVWAAGAEAVAVNEQRLTAVSAIRSAGEAVLVDFRPLRPPYEVRAIGPPAMRTRFAAGFGGSYLQVLRDYGIDFALEDRDRVVLPASAGLSLRYATAPVGGALATSGPPEPSPRESSP